MVSTPTLCLPFPGGHSLGRLAGEKADCARQKPGALSGCYAAGEMAVRLYMDLILLAKQ